MSNLECNDALRIRRQYRGDNIYLIVNFDDAGKLESIGLSQTTGTENIQTTSGLEFVAGLVNLVLELLPENGVEVVRRTANASSLGKFTLPGIICEEFEKFTDKS